MSNRKEIIIPNKKRQALEKVREPYAYEEWGIEPLPLNNVKRDFMNERIRRTTARRLPPRDIPQPAPVPPQHVQSREHVLQGVTTPKAVSTNLEQAWLPPYAKGDIPFDNVPFPPQERFSHEGQQPRDVGISSVLPGQYCLIYDGEIWPAPSKEDLELAIENIFRSDNTVTEEDIYVFYRCNLKVGVSVV